MIKFDENILDSVYNYFSHQESQEIIKTRIYSSYKEIFNLKFTIEDTKEKQKYNNKNFIELKVQNETVNTEYLRSKRIKINTFLKINKALVKLDKSIESEEEIDQTISNYLSVKPNCCKLECKTCVVECMYRIDQLAVIDQKNLQKELKNHAHPTSRKIIDHGSFRQRNTEQTRNELKEHYTFAHSKK